jgi:hypothetical protein
MAGLLLCAFYSQLHGIFLIILFYLYIITIYLYYNAVLSPINIIVGEQVT